MRRPISPRCRVAKGTTYAAAQTLTLVQQHHPDIVLLDLGIHSDVRQVLTAEIEILSTLCSGGSRRRCR